MVHGHTGISDACPHDVHNKTRRQQGIHLGNHDGFQPWGLWLRSSGLLFATFLLLSLFSLVAGLLLASHLYLVASNTTTWEFISSHRIAYLRQRPGNPFDRGLTRNLAHFFCGWPSGSWETLWAEDEEEEGSSQAV